MSQIEDKILQHTVQNEGGGGSKAVWTMLKKTALLEKDGFPYMVKKGKQIRAGVSPPPFQKKTYFFAGGVP